MRRYAKFAVLAVFAAPLFAQAQTSSPMPAAQPATAVASTAAPERFLAADVHAVPINRRMSWADSHRGDWYILRQIQMSALIASAYGLKRISGTSAGPPGSTGIATISRSRLSPARRAQPTDRLCCRICWPNASSWLFILEMFRCPRICSPWPMASPSSSPRPLHRKATASSCHRPLRSPAQPR